VNTTSPAQCKAWAQLALHAESWRGVHLRELFANDVARSVQLVAEAPGLRYDYSRQRLGAMTLRLLAHLAEERGFGEWRDACFPAGTSMTRKTAPPGIPRCVLRMRPPKFRRH
jgi:glucose-6-phosphate isomerase